MDRRSIQISVLAHASILIGFVFQWSFLFPLLMWKTLKHSKYSEKQARQATYYQVFALLLILFVSFTAEFILLSQPVGEGKVQKVDKNLVRLVKLALYSLLSLYALYGAYRCSRGEEFRYLIIGN
ncbi:DUF4870 domain-containing protein [Candidatus Micrarchaeota archaeon]|nr:DUF4870 domain-containing protein [Candidatus Micrarchaeota archaeon]